MSLRCLPWDYNRPAKPRGYSRKELAWARANLPDREAVLILVHHHAAQLKVVPRYSTYPQSNYPDSSARP